MKTNDLIALLTADSATARVERKRDLQKSTMLIAAAIAVVLAVFVILAGIRPDMDNPAVRSATLRKELVTLAAATAGLIATWALARPTTTRSALWVAPALALAALVLWEAVAAGLTGWQTRLIGSNPLACFTIIPLLSMLPLAAILYALRLGAPGNPGKAGAMAGLAAAGFGATVYALHCTDDSMFFVGAWYVLATAVVVAIGALAGARVLRW